MKRRFLAWPLAVFLLFGGAFPAAAELHDPAVQAVIEEAAEAESDAAAGEAEAGTDTGKSDEGSELTEDVAAAIEDASSKYSFKYEPGEGIKPGNPETEELMSNLGVFVDVLNSEEFQRLMEYPEMQALAKTALTRLTDFVMNEPELATKVLVKLGADESAVQLMMKGMGVAQGMIETE